MSLEIEVGRKSDGQIVVDRNTWNLGWMQADSSHLSWQASASEAGALCPYFHLLETFTWQLCMQDIPQSLTGQWCMSEVHRGWKIKPEGPGDSFGRSQFTLPFNLPHFNPPKIMRLWNSCDMSLLVWKFCPGEMRWTWGRLWLGPQGTETSLVWGDAKSSFFFEFSWRHITWEL